MESENLEVTELEESTPVAEPEVEKSEAELALEETAEKPKEDMVPATVVAKQRAARRAAEIEVAELRGRLAAQEKPAVAEKSPIELAAEELGVSVDEVTVDGKILREQRAFEKKQAETTTHQQNLDDFKEAGSEALRTMTDEVHGEGLGLAALEELGAHLLTPGDKLDIFQSGKNCGKTTRDMLITRIARAGGEGAKELRQRLKAHKDSQVEPKVEQKGEPEQKVETPNANDPTESDAFIESIFF